MSEYVYDWTPSKQHRKEEIVRCRDCVKWHMCDVNEDCSMRGSCDEWTHLDGFTHTTREDGFCAWGERRDA